MARVESRRAGQPRRDYEVFTILALSYPHPSLPSQLSRSSMFRCWNNSKFKLASSCQPKSLKVDELRPQ